MKKQHVKLSTAIALGAQHSTQAIGHFSANQGAEECALEAADTFLNPLKRYGAPRKRKGGRSIVKQFGIKLEVLHCPVCKSEQGIASLVDAPQRLSQMDEGTHRGLPCKERLLAASLLLVNARHH